MDESIRCADLADTLAEVATGAASGPDRAQLLRHLTGCEDCRRELDELTRVADEVLLIAPEHEPPAGFEGAVLAQLTGSAAAPPAKRRFARPLLYAAAASLVALGAAGAVWQATADDRNLAAAYRDTLDVADGRYFAAADLLKPSGGSAGTVFLYEGEPSWLFVVVRDAPAPGGYDVVVDAGASSTVVGSCVVDSTTCSVGTTIDDHVYNVDEVRLVSPSGTALTAPIRW
jgi:hypothetical protein